MNIQTSEERIELLKAGYDEKDISDAYLRLNRITFIETNWVD